MSEDTSGLPPPQANPWATQMPAEMTAAPPAVAPQAPEAGIPTPPAIPQAPAAPAAPEILGVGTPIQAATAETAAKPTEANGAAETPAAPVADAPVAALQEASEKLPEVTVLVPKGFNFRPEQGVEIKIVAGIQEMRLDYAEHWYVKAQGVTQYRPH